MTNFQRIGGIFLGLIVQLTTGITSLNGFGEIVDWFFIVKIPQVVYDPETNQPTNAHCPCKDPGDSVGRGAGLCYLYADSINPKLRDFRELGYDCLGQGYNDPISHTLKQMYRSTQIHYGIWNDQLQGLRNVQDQMNMCSRENKFNAHSKGALAHDSESGFFLQTTTPNFPDPSATSFIPLGVQKDNNVFVAQHFFSFSLKSADFDQLGSALSAAGLCSANHYHKFRTYPALSGIISESFRHPNASTLESPIYQALVDPHSEEQTRKTQAIEVLTLVNHVQIELLAKSEGTTVPPWALVASHFKMDISVASWWDNGYGIPTICAKDTYASSPYQFCLADKDQNMTLSPSGEALFNVENLVEAKYFVKGRAYTWKLVGGRVDGGNHGKWAIATPRDRSLASWIVFGDLNMEGYPCSHDCKGAQNGRGGLFFRVANPKLWSSLIHQVINGACACFSTCTLNFIHCRMCGHGCTHHVEALSPSTLPQPSTHSQSFWDPSNLFRDH